MTLWKGPMGGVVPHCLWDGVNDDLLFRSQKVPDWPQRSLSIRQACRAPNSWTRDQILGRSLEGATEPFKHFTISIRVQTLNLLTPTPFHEAELFREISAHSEYADSEKPQLPRARPTSNNIVYPSICTTLLGCPNPS